LNCLNDNIAPFARGERRFGMEKVTIKDIAKMANVSTATVSRVINNVSDGVGPELRAKIMKIVKDTGYRPNLLAKSMVTNKTYTIGLLSPDISTPFFQSVIKGISDCVQPCNYSLILNNVDATGTNYIKSIESILDRGIDGIFLSGFFGETSQQLARLLSGTPVVVFDYIPRNAQLVQINTDNRNAAYKLTNYLLQMGHRRIGCITGQDRYDTVIERLKGYQRALKMHKINYDPSIVLSGELTIESALEPAERLLNMNDVTAIFCFNDLMAYGVYKLCAQLGKRIPEDISIAGFDDLPYSEILTPPLTTIRQPGYRLGFEGAKMLLAQIEGTSDGKTKKIIQNTLIIRDSVKDLTRKK